MPEQNIAISKEVLRKIDEEDRKHLMIIGRSVVDKFLGRRSRVHFHEVLISPAEPWKTFTAECIGSRPLKVGRIIIRRYRVFYGRKDGCRISVFFRENPRIENDYLTFEYSSYGADVRTDELEKGKIEYWHEGTNIIGLDTFSPEVLWEARKIIPCLLLLPEVLYEDEASSLALWLMMRT